MKILREKIFGKLDALEAKRKGITVAELRQQRTRPVATNTVHDSINLRGVSNYDKSAFNRQLRTEMRSTDGYKGARKQAVNELDWAYKDSISNKAKQQKKRQNQLQSKIDSGKIKTKPNQQKTENTKRVADKAMGWIKKNPGKTAAIGGGVAALGAGLGYAAYKHHKNKKSEEK